MLISMKFLYFIISLMILNPLRDRYSLETIILFLHKPIGSGSTCN